ncbi:hypothetical protein [Paraburkholderia sp. RL17-347-BIC-D]|jgi:hypothetical protein
MHLDGLPVRDGEIALIAEFRDRVGDGIVQAALQAAGNEAIFAFWSKGFGAMWDAGSALHEQTKAAVKETVDVIDKARKPVA